VRGGQAAVRAQGRGGGGGQGGHMAARGASWQWRVWQELGEAGVCVPQGAAGCQDHPVSTHADVLTVAAVGQAESHHISK
jgi:hypothetical protein